MSPLKLNSAKHQPYLLWRLMSILAVGLLILATMTSFYFIYQNVYTTLTNQDAILILKASPAIATIDSAGFAESQKIMVAKNTTSTIPLALRNVFVYSTTTLQGPSLLQVTTTPDVPAQPQH